MSFNVYAAILIAVFIVFLIAAYRASKSNRFDWTDMITAEGNKLSATKILQLVGGVVGTWIVIKLTLQGQLDWDIFAIYLAYVASIDGFSKFITAKYSSGSSYGYSRHRRHDDLTEQELHGSARTDDS